MVQDILSSMDSDAVNDIGATIESQQILHILEDCYYELIHRHEWPHMAEICQLESVSDITKPTKMKIPDIVTRVDCVRYKGTKLFEDREFWKDIRYLEPCDFIDRLQARDNTRDDVDIIQNDNDIDLFILNNEAPTWWTSFNDEFIWFDSYDNEVDSTITQSKTQIYGIREPDWKNENTFIPDLPNNLFPVLLNEAKSKAWVELKQTPNNKAEQIAKRLFNNALRDAKKVNRGPQFVDFSKPRRNTISTIKQSYWRRT